MSPLAGKNEFSLACAGGEEGPPPRERGSPPEHQRRRSRKEKKRIPDNLYQKEMPTGGRMDAAH